jgi:proteasome lid subunit RPN8/RPN11
MTPSFSFRTVEAAKAAALAEFPKESCGLVVGGEYVPIKNVSGEPTEAYRMPDDTWLRYRGQIQAVIHSHTGARVASRIGEDLRAPSAADMKCQMQLSEEVGHDLPFGIVWASDKVSVTEPIWFGDFVLDWPLIGREFLSGVTDCYSIIRGHYWQTRKIKLLDFPRDQNWWEDKEAKLDFYNDKFEEVGFRRISSREARADDVVLIRATGVTVPNHAAILRGDGSILEHCQSQLSRRATLARWSDCIDGFLRYSQ